MTDLAEHWVAVAKSLSDARASELALVLTARGVPFERRGGFEAWELWVPLAMAPQAATELALYRHENARQIGARPLAEVGDGRLGVVAYAAMLIAVFVAVHDLAFHFDWLAAGGLEAGAVLSGEWWRTVTALTVHVELAHLLGNLAFGAFFGYFVGRYFGSGVGWLAVLLTAAVGNGLNAWVEVPGHRSIGASTAVFAALGLLVAYTWRRGFFRHTPWRARIAPIVAGLGLLAFTGTAGENTDLGAHLFGFVTGFGGGLLFARFATTAWLENEVVQRVAGALAALLVAGAWGVGLLLKG